MASLTIISNRNDDNSHTVTVHVPARRLGEPNMGALERVVTLLENVVPDAFDPPPILDAYPVDEPEGLKAGEAWEDAA